MKITIFASAFALLALTACETVAPASPAMEAVSSASTQITTLEEFNRLIVGNRLRQANSNFVVNNSDGSLTGEFGGANLEGTWWWEGKYWCRTLTTIQPGTDCQLWEINGTELTVTRDRGNGGATTYTLE